MDKIETWRYYRICTNKNTITLSKVLSDIPVCLAISSSLITSSLALVFGLPSNTPQSFFNSPKQSILVLKLGIKAERLKSTKFLCGLNKIFILRGYD